MCTTREVHPRKKRRRCEDNRGEKITMMQQRSTADSRRRLINFTMLVSQSMSAILRQSV